MLVHTGARLTGSCQSSSCLLNACLEAGPRPEPMAAAEVVHRADVLEPEWASVAR
jgi:hypothetical protein